MSLVPYVVEQLDVLIGVLGLQIQQLGHNQGCGSVVYLLRQIMIHQPSAGTQGQITDMAIHLRRLEIIKKRMNQILSDNTGKPIEVVTSDCERDNFIWWTHRT